MKKTATKKNAPVYTVRSKKGLSASVVRLISAQHHEPAWMLENRLSALKIFYRKKMPDWGAKLSNLSFKDLTYYWRATNQSESRWSDIPKKIKQTFEQLGIPKAERKFLAGLSAQYESEIVYHRLKERFTKLGVVFCDMSEAPHRYPDLVRQYYGTVVGASDNKFAALNSAVWSGGSFIYVPKNVKVALPLQTYFRINAPAIGQFERTLIIADQGSSVHYIEGCTAPTYSRYSLHAAVVEVIALPKSRVRYTTIQNWSDNVYNLVTKRAVAHQGATVEWVDGNLGSHTTMKYPAVILKGKKAVADILSVAVANRGQHQDTGAKVIHLAPETSSRIISKSVSLNGGRSSYRGLVKIAPNAKKSKVKVSCDALLLDKKSRADTYPTIRSACNDSLIEHEAAARKISAEQLFYLQARGLTPTDAERMVVAGFLEIFTRTLPLEYAVELNRLIELEMEGSVG